MSRPSLFDEKCEVCNYVCFEAPYYDGKRVGEKVYCNACHERLKRQGKLGN